MPGIDAIVNKIIEDANKQAADIIDNANEEALRIVNEATLMAKEEAEKIKATGKAKAESLRLRMKSESAMENRKLRLNVKKEIIDSVFKSAEEKLKSMPGREYAEYIMRLVTAHSITGDEEIIISESDNARLPQNFLGMLNESISKKGIKANLSLNVVSDNIFNDNGFILRRGDVDLNATFSSMLKQRKDDLELLVSGILFLSACMRCKRKVEHFVYWR